MDNPIENNDSMPVVANPVQKKPFFTIRKIVSIFAGLLLIGAVVGTVLYSQGGERLQGSLISTNSVVPISTTGTLTPSTILSTKDTVSTNDTLTPATSGTTTDTVSTNDTLTPATSLSPGSGEAVAIVEKEIICDVTKHLVPKTVTPTLSSYSSPVITCICENDFAWDANKNTCVPMSCDLTYDQVQKMIATDITSASFKTDYDTKNEYESWRKINECDVPVTTDTNDSISLVPLGDLTIDRNETILTRPDLTIVTDDNQDIKINPDISINIDRIDTLQPDCPDGMILEGDQCVCEGRTIEIAGKCESFVLDCDAFDAEESVEAFKDKWMKISEAESTAAETAQYIHVTVDKMVNPAWYPKYCPTEEEPRDVCETYLYNIEIAKDEVAKAYWEKVYAKECTDQPDEEIITYSCSYIIGMLERAEADTSVNYEFWWNQYEINKCDGYNKTEEPDEPEKPTEDITEDACENIVNQDGTITYRGDYNGKCVDIKLECKDVDTAIEREVLKSIYNSDGTSDATKAYLENNKDKFMSDLWYKKYCTTTTTTTTQEEPKKSCTLTIVKPVDANVAGQGSVEIDEDYSQQSIEIVINNDGYNISEYKYASDTGSISFSGAGSTYFSNSKIAYMDGGPDAGDSDVVVVWAVDKELGGVCSDSFKVYRSSEEVPKEYDTNDTTTVTENDDCPVCPTVTCPQVTCPTCDCSNTDTAPDPEDYVTTSVTSETPSTTSVGSLHGAAEETSIPGTSPLHPGAPMPGENPQTGPGLLLLFGAAGLGGAYVRRKRK
ncbi:hypothetical protein KKD70_03745 [Patescibacteria group bacterium]|nr:hypothetical protein [Patescibacteria group bacterium]